MRDVGQQILANLARVVVGKTECLELMIVGLLAEGHGLLEALPRGATPSRGTPSAESDAIHYSPTDNTGHDPSFVIWAVLSLVLMLVVAAWVTRRWLFSETDKAGDSGSLYDRIVRWLEHSRTWLRGFVRRWFALQEQHDSIRHYSELLAWGRRSGIPGRVSETPLEYARRLQKQLNTAASEIDVIVSTFNAHVYGQAPYDRQTSTRARHALSRLRSPLLWPKRLSTWLSSD